MTDSSKDVHCGVSSISRYCSLFSATEIKHWSQATYKEKRFVMEPEGPDGIVPALVGAPGLMAEQETESQRSRMELALGFYNNFSKKEPVLLQRCHSPPRTHPLKEVPLGPTS
jgi:hypothetical protein